MCSYFANEKPRNRDTSDKKKRPRRKILLIAGVSFISAAALIVAGLYIYVYFTNRSAKRAQEHLLAAWEKSLEMETPEKEEIAPGDPVAQLIVPRLGLDAVVVELAGLDDRENLNKGPAHIPGTAYPGESGNVVIAGHRTTYGAPFGNIDALEVGDEFIFRTKGGEYTYEIYDKRIVDDNDLSVLVQEGEPRATLFACHPKYFARERIIVEGRLKKAD